MRTWLVEIDLKRPDVGDEDGWGTAAVYNGNPARWTAPNFKNCNDHPIPHARVSIDHEWTKTEDVVIDDITYPNITFTHADNKAYWDWYYGGVTLFL